MTPSHWTFNWEPTWPWSGGTIGPPGFFVVALLLALLTFWTYLGVPGAGFRRVLLLLGLRLAALVLAFLAVLRPSLAFREEAHVPSTLLFALDDSKSMTFKDDYDGQARWDHLLRILKRSAPLLQHLHDEHDVNIVFHSFSESVHSFDPADAQAKAEGKRSDYGLMLETLYNQYRGERYLRGLVVLGDGTNNGPRQPLNLAGPWRNLPCPIHTFAFGKPTTGEREADVAITSIRTDPPQVIPVKQRMRVIVTVDAPGFAENTVKVRLFLDDKETKVLVNNKEADFQDEVLHLTENNEVILTCNAPEKPGEVKVTVKIDPLHGETALFNNEISTYVTISKEGLSVLLIDKVRLGAQIHQ